MQIHIGGQELAGPDAGGFEGFALIAASYAADGRPLGSLGVLGPTRMEYGRVIAVVDAVARDLGRALHAGFAGPH